MNYFKSDFLDDIIENGKACQREFPISLENFDNFFKGDIDPAEANDIFKCFVKCIMEKDGSFSNGSFVLPMYVESLKQLNVPEDVLVALQKAGEECKIESGSNECDTAFKIAVCINEKFDLTNNS